MAAFQIHEDIENIGARTKKILGMKIPIRKEVGNNYQRIPVKQYFTKKHEENKVQKKSFFNNRVPLQPPKAQNILLDVSLEKNKEEEDIDGSFLIIEKENKIETVKEEKDPFPVSLLHNNEYREEIWTYLLNLEQQLPLPQPKFMAKQQEITWDSRSILVDWLVSVAEEYKLADETLHLSVNYIDRFLGHISVAKNKFQLVGAAAMMIATKMEEYYPIDAKEWSYLTSDTFTPQQVLKMEQVVLKVLRFRMQTPTINGFIQQLAVEYKMDEKTQHLAMYIAELVLLEGDDYLTHFPSKLASACIALARYTLLKRITWPKKLKKASGYSLKELSPVVKRQHKTLKDSPLKQQQAVQTKYKSPKFSRVALTKPRLIIMEDFNID
ncbi:cyclin-A2-like [Diabrotica virgifera virgifera]|uniref:G2/mitotic-specific cyclin-A-like n=1 Tax=Diabrotica virgifera virgifera TaxID=50390 RepID=A0ABM5JK39_DIAVI|nr:cyclin-A2-like [Diabrotica virgifera virgifera]